MNGALCSFCLRTVGVYDVYLVSSGFPCSTRLADTDAGAKSIKTRWRVNQHVCFSCRLHSWMCWSDACLLNAHVRRPIGNVAPQWFRLVYSAHTHFSHTRLLSPQTVPTTWPACVNVFPACTVFHMLVYSNPSCFQHFEFDKPTKCPYSACSPPLRRIHRLPDLGSLGTDCTPSKEERGSQWITDRKREGELIKAWRMHERTRCFGDFGAWLSPGLAKPLALRNLGACRCNVF